MGGVFGVAWAKSGKGSSQQSRVARTIVMDRRIGAEEGCSQTGAMQHYNGNGHGIIPFNADHSGRKAPGVLS